jgi:uncharacterized protein involved in outer membrane biogenesis
MARRKIPRWPVVVGVIIAAIAAVVAVFRWDWFIPTVERRASAALGRQVTIGHLHVGLGQVTTITADHVTIADPAGFPPDQHLATIDRLEIEVDLAALIRDHAIRIPEIDIQHPVADVVTSPDGTRRCESATSESKTAMRTSLFPNSNPISSSPSTLAKKPRPMMQSSLRKQRALMPASRSPGPSSVVLC